MRRTFCSSRGGLNPYRVSGPRCGEQTQSHEHEILPELFWARRDGAAVKHPLATNGPPVPVHPRVDLGGR